MEKEIQNYKAEEMFFQSPTKGEMNLAEVARDISSFIDQDAECSYQIVVGTDSSAVEDADFISVIIVYRIGRGGRYFWKKTKGDQKYKTLRERIYKEVILSVDTARSILGELQGLLEVGYQLNYDFQIHIDVGENGPTKQMVKEVVGIVQGNGFKAKIKPESYAASSIADKHVRG